jgi:hypothetical protein
VNVVLNADEARLAYTMAQTRAKRNEAAGVVERFASIDGRNKIVNAYHSYGAEIAAAKAMNLYPDINTDPGNIRSADLVTQDGLRIDVKWTNRTRVSIPNNRRTVDVYIVVSGACPRYKIEGWVWSARARSDPFWAIGAPVPCWQVPIDALEPVRSPVDLRRLRRTGEADDRLHAGAG